ncbi:MAG: histidine--tRNA ligase [Candidatus Marinimicrobia bacterium]|jgi:histidyl-tRNA synthetase|nr:histidine--tRNA ligase [Candidatus Neomarinimicrobiota bacterium]
MEKNIIRAIKGTKDILPDQSKKWQDLESSFRNFIQAYGYREIRTPAFEKTELFERGVGEGTDIVTKEMYTWEDRNGKSLTLKPELTAPVVRAYIQNNLAGESPLTKLYYFDSLFRRERPQKGRQRQFHQFGIEAIGSPYPECDAEVVASAYLFLSGLGLSELTLKLNSIGSKKSRKNYCDALIEFLNPFKNQLSELSQKRLSANPVRILDTKFPHEIDILKDAPVIYDFLSEDDKTHFNEVMDLLDGLNIPYTRDNHLVRGLDYYCRTTFEITSEVLGGQDALCGGGRYDNLVELLGGKPTPAMGFAAGVERILIALNEKTPQSEKFECDIYVITMLQDSIKTGIIVANQLRQSGFRVEMDSLRRSMKSQLREANKMRAKYTAILGEEELKSKKITIKEMGTGDQKTIEIDSILSFFQK